MPFSTYSVDFDGVVAAVELLFQLVHPLAQLEISACIDIIVRVTYHENQVVAASVIVVLGYWVSGKLL